MVATGGDATITLNAAGAYYVLPEGAYLGTYPAQDEQAGAVMERFTIEPREQFDARFGAQARVNGAEHGADTTRTKESRAMAETTIDLSTEEGKDLLAKHPEIGQALWDRLENEASGARIKDGKDMNTMLVFMADGSLNLDAPTMGFDSDINIKLPAGSYLRWDSETLTVLPAEEGKKLWEAGEPVKAKQPASDGRPVKEQDAPAEDSPAAGDAAAEAERGQSKDKTGSPDNGDGAPLTQEQLQKMMQQAQQGKGGGPSIDLGGAVKGAAAAVAATASAAAKAGGAGANAITAAFNRAADASRERRIEVESRKLGRPGMGRPADLAVSDMKNINRFGDQAIRSMDNYRSVLSQHGIPPQPFASLTERQQAQVRSNPEIVRARRDTEQKLTMFDRAAQSGVVDNFVAGIKKGEIGQETAAPLLKAAYQRLNQVHQKVNGEHRDLPLGSGKQDKMTGQEKFTNAAGKMKETMERTRALAEQLKKIVEKLLSLLRRGKGGAPAKG